MTDGGGGGGLLGNAIVNVVNVLFFVTVQTLFFTFIASREANRVAERKARVLGALRRELRRSGLGAAVLSLDGALAGWRTSNAAGAGGGFEGAAARRRDANRRLTQLWIGSVVLGLVVLLAVLIAALRLRRQPFAYANRVGLGLVVLAYAVEVLFFVGVVERWEMVGDWELVLMALGADGADGAGGAGGADGA